MTTSILVVEDDKQIIKYLKSAITSNNMTFFGAQNAKEAIQKIISNHPDIIILDLGLPDLDGQDLIKEIREWSHTPIVVLSAREAEVEKIKALENGADDYITKPFNTGELFARIKVALRHSKKLNSQADSIFKFEYFTLDFASRRVFIENQEVRLTPIEYKLLSILVKNSGKLITRSQLLKEVWGKNFDDHGNHLRVHTQHLREKLGDNPLSPRLIITIPGIGYRFGEG
ncbi:response regulator [Pseudaquidulcibacter saccharophilus]|uniref:response regulator n=1 Tax=Pseudaquidulcibacter saccharophilus TaxID=2831900 RepID=UPI001EFF3F7B|nr:response regulator [Pseudaquidulcibacter saccharophilus]